MSEKQNDDGRMIEAQSPAIEDLEVTEDESRHVKGGKVAMQDFHFVMRINKSSP